MSATAPSPVRAIVRVRLAPWLRCQAFEHWLRGMPTVLAAALITGEANCELRVDCPSFTDLGDVLTHVCECRGVELESTALVLHAVAGLPPRPTTVAERVTTKRPLTM